MEKDYLEKYGILFNFHLDQLDKQHAEVTNNLALPVEYLVEYMKLVKDYFISTVDPENMTKEEDKKVSNLFLAIETYENYKNIAEKTAKDKKLKMQHWNAFWALVATNIKDWSIAND